MRGSFLFAVLVVACRAGVVTFNETLFHVTLAGTFPPRPSCVLDRDVHLLTGQVDPTLGGTVRVHVANGTVPDYDRDFGKRSDSNSCVASSWLLQLLLKMTR